MLYVPVTAVILTIWSENATSPVAFQVLFTPLPVVSVDEKDAVQTALDVWPVIDRPKPPAVMLSNAHIVQLDFQPITTSEGRWGRHCCRVSLFRLRN